MIRTVPVGLQRESDAALRIFVHGTLQIHLAHVDAVFAAIIHVVMQLAVR